MINKDDLLLSIERSGGGWQLEENSFYEVCAHEYLPGVLRCASVHQYKENVQKRQTSES